MTEEQIQCVKDGLSRQKLYIALECIEELEKENEQLQKNNKHIQDLIEAERQRQEECNNVHLRDIEELEKENEQLKQQIAKMKQDVK